MTYFQTNAGIFLTKTTTENGQRQDRPIQLANFQAKIIREIIYDDGAEQRCVLELEAELNDRKSNFTLTAAQFEAMNWITDKLGPTAVVFPSHQHLQHIRTAIQLKLKKVVQERIFCHTGWVEHEGESVYLHAGGAIHPGSWPVPSPPVAPQSPDIVDPNSLQVRMLPAAGPVGPVVDKDKRLVRTRLSDGLEKFDFGIANPNASEIRSAIVNVLWLMSGRAIPAKIIVPLVAAAFRSVLGIPAGLSVFLAGSTGTFKTECASIIQRFFGRAMDAQHLPASFNGTTNAILAQSFVLKDSLLVVDDFCPTGSGSDVQRQHREADQFFRAVANQVGRNRAKPDGSLRPSRPPRALILATGEEIPKGKSLRARILILEVVPDSIDASGLRTFQQIAAEGEFALAMAAFICWLGPILPGVHQQWMEDREEWKTDAPPGLQHRRTWIMIRELAYGLIQFLEFAKKWGVLTDEQVDELGERWFETLQSVAHDQDRFLTSSDPVDQSLQLLASLFGTKAVHVANIDGKPPEIQPDAMGYRKVKFESPAHAGPPAEDDEGEAEQVYAWLPCGKKIGWVFGDTLYLIPAIAFAEISALANRTGDGITLTLRTWERHLADRGIVNRDEKRNRILRRLIAEGARHYVLQMSMGHVQWIEDWGTDPEQKMEEAERQKSFSDLLC